MHVSSHLVSSAALLHSMSSDRFDVIFVSSSRKKAFYIKHLIHAYIIFIEQRDYIFPKRQLFSTHANFMHCGKLLWSKSLLHFCISVNFGVRNQKMTSFTLCKFLNRWNNSILHENLRNSLKQLRTTLCYL